MPLVLGIRGQSVAGPFAFVVSPDDLTVNSLNQGLRDQVATTQDGVVGTTVTVVNQAGPPGPAGASGGPGASAGPNVAPNLAGLYAVDTTGEQFFTQDLADLTALTSSPMTVKFSARIMSVGGATGTFRVRLGGTERGVDGTIIASLTTISPTYETKSVTATVTNPGGISIIKLTGQTSVSGKDALVESVIVALT